MNIFTVRNWLNLRPVPFVDPVGTSRSERFGDSLDCGLSTLHFV